MDFLIGISLACLTFTIYWNLKFGWEFMSRYYFFNGLDIEEKFASLFIWAYLLVPVVTFFLY